MRYLLAASLLFISACSGQVERQAPQAVGVTAFEGARLITGDGSAPIEDSVFIVDNNHFTAIGRRGAVQIPAGAARVDLAGKTAYVANPVTNDVSVVDVKTMKETAKIPVGFVPKRNTTALLQ